MGLREKIQRSVESRRLKRAAHSAVYEKEKARVMPELITERAKKKAQEAARREVYASDIRREKVQRISSGLKKQYKKRYARPRIKVRPRVKKVYVPLGSPTPRPRSSMPKSQPTNLFFGGPPARKPRKGKKIKWF